MSAKVHHPRGLSTLFFTEMWERFSYYGMRAFLILYMTAPAVSGGLGFPVARATSIYGTYTGSAWAAAIIGGILADRGLGQYRAVLIGGIIIAAGHFTLAFHALPFFYLGLSLIVIGTGLLKPNVSAMVGSLYEEGDTRRDAGFSIFYMGINLGGALGPLIAGYLAQKVDWHIGFACAGIGMFFGLLQYILGKERLRPAIDKLSVRGKETTVRTAGKSAAAASAEWKRLATIGILFVFAALFWGAYEQNGSTLNLFADRYTRLSMFGFSFPSSWFQSVPAIFVIILAPVMAALWTWLGPREPSSPAKFAIGLLFAGLSFLILVPAASMAQSQGMRVSPWWLIGSYFVIEIGELALSPIGLSVVTKLAPARIVGVMMGVWLLSIAAGDKIAGWAAGFFTSFPLPTLFGYVALVTLIAAAVLGVIVQPVRKLMGGVK